MKHTQVNHKKAALLGLQHLLAMYSGAIAVPLLIGTALKFNSTQMTYLVSIDIFMCGLATALQLLRNRYFGIGLPVVLGCAIQAVAPLQMIGKKFTIGTMYGAIIVAGVFVFLVAGYFSKIKKLFPPVVKSIDVLVGLIAGTLIASTLGMVSLTPVAQASWFHLPQPFYFGMPQFEWSSSLTMIIIALVSMVESTGVFFAIGDLLHKDITSDDLKKGYRAEGLAQILGGIFNTFPYTTFSQNVGLLELSGITTKRPIYWASGFLMLMGLLPKFGALVTIIPDSVLGGAMLVMFTMIAVQGMRMLKRVDFEDTRNILIVAISIGLGLGVTVYPQVFQALPETIQLFLGNGIVVASLSATILNLLFKGKSGLEEQHIPAAPEKIEVQS